MIVCVEEGAEDSKEGTPVNARMTMLAESRHAVQCSKSEQKSEGAERKGCGCQSGTRLLQVGVGTVCLHGKAASVSHLRKLRTRSILPRVSDACLSLLSGRALVMIVVQATHSVKRLLACKRAGRQPLLVSPSIFTATPRTAPPMLFKYRVRLLVVPQTADVFKCVLTIPAAQLRA